MERLTDVHFWEDRWWRGAGPSRLRLYRDVDFEMVRLLREAAGAPGARVLEVGAGNSRVLPYLAKKFGYRVFGNDFSWRGCVLLRANLSLQGVEGLVVAEDLFRSSLPSAAFDLVFSSGLIEHFDDLGAIVAKHVEFVKPGGRLVLIVPNLQGIQGQITRRLAPSLWQVHRVFGPADLAAALEGQGLRGVRSGYLGSFFIRILRGEGWTETERWPRWLARLVHDSMRLLNGLVSLGFRLSPLRPHGRIFSPAFFAAGIRPAPDPEARPGAGRPPLCQS
jgi:SAM-dependent methyltransferase